MWKNSFKLFIFFIQYKLTLDFFFEIIIDQNVTKTQFLQNKPKQSHVKNKENTQTLDL